MLVQRITKKLVKKSSSRPKSLVLNIPAQTRDLMQWQHGTSVNIDVIMTDNEKYVKITEDKEKE